MLNKESALRLAIFISVGYLCAGTIFSVFASIPLWLDYLQLTFIQATFGVVISLFLSSLVGMLLVRYFVPRYGAKEIYEQDILIYMIGMLFVALTINEAMFIIGLFVAMGSLAVFFYENFKRQITVARTGTKYSLFFAGWLLGPVISIIVITIFYDLGLLIVRLLFAHYIALAFFVWIQRLALHEDYKDASQILFGKVKFKSASSDVKEHKSDIENTQDIKESDINTDKKI